MKTQTQAARPRVTTTHDVHGGGRPRLVLLFEDGIDLAMARSASGRISEIELKPGVSTVGSDPNSDVWLPDIDLHQAEIRRDEFDEYVIVDLDSRVGTRVDGKKVESHAMHSGDRIQFGRWTMTYRRAEFADHGEPYGGHTGGWFWSHPKEQSVPRPRGTSPTGGSEPHGDDPGEYF